MNIPGQLPNNACIFLDVDGTLIDLAATPDAVVIPPRLVDDIARVERLCGGALALVSGRSIAQLDGLFAPLKLKAAGAHGAEFRVSDIASGRWARARPLDDALWGELSTLLADFPGTLTENKVFSYAVHFRSTPDNGPRLRAALERFLAAHDGLGLQLLPGHYVYELKQDGVDKGAAIREFMEREPFAGRVPLFIGDDVTDTPGFAAVTVLGGHAYSVKQTFPGVDATFKGPAAVRRWLAEIADQETLTA